MPVGRRQRRCRTFVLSPVRYLPIEIWDLGRNSLKVLEHSSESLMADEFSPLERQNRSIQRAGIWWSVGKSLMGPLFGIVCHELAEQVLQVLLSQDHEMVKTFVLDSANPRLGERVHIG